MKPGQFLDQILIQKRKEVDLLIQQTNAEPEHRLNRILKQSRERSFLFSKALKGSALAIIGELKRRSPSRGMLQEIEDPMALALRYCQGEISAISVLTDEKYFGGSLSDLSHVSGITSLYFPQVPCLRKEFILHPLQLAEAVLAGASAVLFIASVVGKELGFLIEQAHELGLEALVEVHDLPDLELALQANAAIIGINHRNLTTFEMDMQISEVLRPRIPPHIITVAESGIQAPAQAKRMRELGFDAILVGEALVVSKDPTILVRQMRGDSDES